MIITDGIKIFLLMMKMSYVLLVQVTDNIAIHFMNIMIHFNFCLTNTSQYFVRIVTIDKSNSKICGGLTYAV